MIQFGIPRAVLYDMPCSAHTTFRIYDYQTSRFGIAAREPFVMIIYLPATSATQAIFFARFLDTFHLFFGISDGAFQLSVSLSTSLSSTATPLYRISREPHFFHSPDMFWMTKRG